MDKRIHFLDQMRSHMMLLGVVLHVAGNYNTMPVGELWPYKDLSTDGFFSFLVTFIHSFRMQVFFLVAGFFAAMLIGKNGNLAFLKNRSKRILLPFLLLFLPISGACFVLFRQGAAIMAARGAEVEFQAQWPLYHLWFLYYLFIYCLLAVPLCWVLQRVALNTGLIARFVRFLPWVLCLMLAGIHIIKGSYLLDTPVGFGIVWGVFSQYGLFFAVGLVGYQCRDIFFAGFISWKRWLSLALVAVVLFVATVSYTAQTQPDDPHAVVWYGAVFLGFYYVALCWAIMALYQRYFNRFSRVGRYLSEASYWVYLVHLPLAIAIPMMMDGWMVTGWIKFVLALASVFAISIVTYHFLVRSTALGALLNGHKRAFVWPFSAGPDLQSSAGQTTVSLQQTHKE